MKAHEILTVMATEIVKPAHWRRNGYGPLDGGTRHCLVGKQRHVLRRLGLGASEQALSDKVSVALKHAIYRRDEHDPNDSQICIEEWNDRLAKNARDVADLCHEAALIAKERE